MSKENIFYTYIYFDPRKEGSFIYGEYTFDYEPFYVGKGHDYQLNSHLNDAKNNTFTIWNKHKFFKIKKILNENIEPIILKIKENIYEYEAFDLEIWLVWAIGRSDLKLGPLTNHTDGGDGVSGRIIEKGKNHHNYGRKVSVESRNKMSSSQKKRFTKELKNQCREREKGNIKSCGKYIVTFPDKHQEDIIGLKRFCEKVNLNFWGVSAAKKKGILYKGYYFQNYNKPKTTYWLGKNHTQDYKNKMSSVISKVRLKKYWSTKKVVSNI